MTTTQQDPIRCFEDFEDGYVFESTVPALTAGEIVEFATLYDPQRFHLDPEAASKTHFGGLVASGFQTQLLCFQPFCREVLLNAQAVGAPGIDSLKWLRPWYPGETLAVSVRLIDKRLSSKRQDRGYLQFQLQARCNAEPVLEMNWMIIMLTGDAVTREVNE